jgi:GNAT superfamily N-acetyltransferase
MISRKLSKLALIETESQLVGLTGAIDPHTLTQHAPDAHWVLLQDQVVTARCSLWWQHPPAYGEHRVGLMGHYAAEDLASAQQILTHATKQLADQGCTIAIAPIDGNTWRRYRLLSQRGTEPMFFLEPDNPDSWCDHFDSQGFHPIAHYSSALATDLTQLDPRLTSVAERLEQRGVKVRSIDVDRFEAELEAIHLLSLISFRDNFLYTPIEQAEFVAHYSQIQSYLQPELVLLAEQAGKLVGFLFALPDLLQSQRGQAIDTVIIKTVAVLPGRDYAGLGNLLVSRCQAIAAQLGYTRAIHALMHDDNQSRNLSSRYAHIIRRYTLFSKVSAIDNFANPDDVANLEKFSIPDKIPN